MPENIKPLTALRFYAALWVVAFSYWGNLAGVGAAPRLVEHGYLGVDLFFVLSGFILAHVYMQGFAERRVGYGHFLWARLARIYPLHLATLAGMGLMGAVAVVLGFRMTHPIVDLGSLPANLTLTHAWGLARTAAWNHPSWSISAEWFAYLSFPLFAAAAWSLRNRPRLAVAGALVLLFAIHAGYRATTGEELTTATIAWGALRIVPCFAYGCAIYLLWRSGAVKTTREALLGVALFVAAILVSVQSGLPDAATVAGFGGLILALAGLSSTGSRRLTSPVGVYLGEISFAIYMVCVPWQVGFVNLSEKLLHLEGGKLPAPLWAVFVLGVIPVAAAAHHLVERPARAAMRAASQSRALAPATRRHAA